MKSKMEEEKAELEHERRELLRKQQVAKEVGAVIKAEIFEVGI